MAADIAPVPQLTGDDLLRPSPQACPDRFRPLFPRRDQAAPFGAYAEGLLAGKRRKSVERMVLRQPAGAEPGMREGGCRWTPPTGPSRGCTWRG